MADQDREIGSSATFKRRWYQITTNVYAPAVAIAPVAGSPGSGAARGTFSYETTDSIDVGGTSQEVLPANTARRALFIQNLSNENLWVNLAGGVAAADAGVKLLPDAALTLPGDLAFIPTTAVNIVGATAGSKFTVLEA